MEIPSIPWRVKAIATRGDRGAHRRGRWGAADVASATRACVCVCGGGGGGEWTERARPNVASLR